MPSKIVLITDFLAPAPDGDVLLGVTLDLTAAAVVETTVSAVLAIVFVDLYIGGTGLGLLEYEIEGVRDLRLEEGFQNRTVVYDSSALLSIMNKKL
ncbi:hypothetical protein ACFL20_04520 [Spirochaetota bacterium]